MGYHLDPRMPKPEQCVQRYMLERWAAKQPDKVFAIYPDGTEWTYRETQQIASRTANALRALGVKQGERVLSWLPNGAECLRIWFGLNYLGAVFVPLNLAYRGGLLQHVAWAFRGAAASCMPTCSAAWPTSIARRCARSSCSAARRSRIAGMIVHGADVLRLSRRRRRRSSSATSRRGTRSPSSTRRARPARRRACCRPTCTSTTMAVSAPFLGGGRPLHGQPADVPFGRRHAGHGDADAMAARSRSSTPSTPNPSGRSSGRPAPPPRSCSA